MDLPLTHALVVLCGGRGRRLGGAIKPLLAYDDGTTILTRLLARLGPGAAEIWISATEETAPALRRAVCAPVVLDPGQGPAGALAAAAAVVRSPLILLVGGDQPRLGPAALAPLFAAAPDAPAVVPASSGLRCPIPGLYATAATRRLGALDGASLQSVLDRLGARVIEGVSATALAGVNTPEDAAAEGLVRRLEGPDHPRR